MIQEAMFQTRLSIRVEASPKDKRCTEDETELFGSEQLACAFYMACDEDPSNSNVQRVLQEGYQVAVRPRSLPLDVKI